MSWGRKDAEQPALQDPGSPPATEFLMFCCPKIKLLYWSQHRLEDCGVNFVDIFPRKSLFGRLRSLTWETVPLISE